MSEALLFPQRRRGRHQHLLSGHHATVFGRRLMVVAQEVEQAVGEEETNLLRDRLSVLRRLPSCGGKRNHYVSEEVRMQHRTLPFRHGKCEDIGRSILAPIVSVESMNQWVATEEDGNLCGVPIDGSKHRLRRLSYARVGNGALLEALASNMYGHGGSMSRQRPASTQHRSGALPAPKENEHRTDDAKALAPDRRSPYTPAVFQRILIASRSAAALRVARTCRRLDIASVGIHDGTEYAHLDACDVRVEVPLVEGRLDPAQLVAIAREHEVDAVHPGYCDRGADLALARHLEAEDVTYIGLDPDAMETVASWRAFQQCIERAGAATIPASEPVDGAMEAVAAARELGFPVHLRAGALGEASSVLHDDEALFAAWERLEEKKNVVVEKWFDRARVLEVLVAADSEGQVEPLTERETTLRVNGKVLVEESPAPALSFRIDGEAIREMSFDIAIRVAKELGSVGLIRVEMLLTTDGQLFPIRAHLGLPSLASVVEKVTGLDLLHLQLRLAAGQPLPEEVLVLQPSGHAIGARVLGDQDNTQAPSELHFPSGPQRSVVVEASTVSGESVPADDGEMLARITCFAPIRHQAALTLARECINKHGGCEADASMGEHWAHGRFSAPYWRETLWESGYAVDTMETAVNWNQVIETVEKIEGAISQAAESQGRKAHVYTHLSHMYGQGCSVYTTYIFACASNYKDTRALWHTLKSAGAQATVKQGGTISHQHGVGYDHKQYLPAEKGELGIKAIEQLCQMFDPDQRMNPGKLLPDND